MTKFIDDKWAEATDDVIGNMREINAKFLEQRGMPQPRPTLEEFCEMYKIPDDVKQKLIERIAEELW